MRTTIELPDDLLLQAKVVAATNGISLRQFFIEAVRFRLAPERPKLRRVPPAVGKIGAKPIKALTRETIDEAMFG